MERSPLVRFALAGLLIVLIVSLTFMYGNAQRAKELAARNKARQEAIKQQATAKRQAKSTPPASTPSNSAPAKPSTESTAPSGSSSASAQVDSSLEVVGQPASGQPTTSEPSHIPDTGSTNGLSLVFGTTVIAALLTALAARKSQAAL